MKVSYALSAFAGLSSSVSAYQSFAGSNLYYAAGLSTDEQKTLFTGLQEADVQVLRVWLDGETSPQKGTKFTSYPSLEGQNPEKYDDTVLNNLDGFMANAHDYGIKLIVSFYSYNALRPDENGNHQDFYGTYYGTGYFYSDPQAITYYKNRIAHVMSHVNPNNGKTWAESSEYIFAFETQNEADHDDKNTDALIAWQCEIAGAIKSNLNGSTDILTTTGGSSYVGDSVRDAYFSCDALDMIAIHAYDTNNDLTTGNLAKYVTNAVKNNKKLIMQEWGICYYNTDNKNCFKGDKQDSGTRDSLIKTYYDNIAQAGLPAMYWEIVPNAVPHGGDYDFEIGIGQENWEAYKEAVQAALSVPSQFDFSKWLPK
ncbi:uncharacterized protein RCC_09470 [Ramularia collo-cygni]|uniref:mannan endo-1,4-beta-mannosidase n=1 Tax=Ramularia collo-cygni TaxID=112498 RepID=A0A2D3V307_9PEZI|nr:uncharacterized protein RCC_09470 [Ramularia collo-cygni]CZT23756.1 uncharacterized protein RCC_09470 [Ramularia collo-cygni]